MLGHFGPTLEAVGAGDDELRGGERAAPRQLRPGELLDLVDVTRIRVAPSGRPGADGSGIA
jgi:hypothetical protein